jgi:L-rhamnose mutarotase
MGTRRLCLALDLKSDAAAIAEYERLHQPGNVWPEVIANIRARGFVAMEIWRTGTRLMMIAEVAADAPDPAPSTDAVNARWEDEAWRFQQALPTAQAGERWVPMRLIFDLSLHGPQDRPDQSYATSS